MQWDFWFLGNDEALASKNFHEKFTDKFKGEKIIDVDIDGSNISNNLLVGRYVVALSSENCIRKCKRV